jgi:hypothetical protein
MTLILDRQRFGPARRLAIVLLTCVMCLVGVQTADALTQFVNANGVISLGVAPWGAPLNPGVPQYLANNFNGRTDIFTNPGIGQTANPIVANNTVSIGPLAWGPGQSIFAFQNGGGNGFGPFGSGAAQINGPQFGYRLADGGVPGGVSTSYEIMTWDANFNQLVGAPVGTLGTFISMRGRVPLNQDLAMISLRTRLIGTGGPAIGNHEVPGLILAVERTGPATYNALALQDNINGGAGATPMPGGWAILINSLTGDFRALAYNVFPDLGAADGFAIPTGALFQARVTATVYADPASMEFLDPFAPENADLLAAALNSSGTPVPFPTDTLIGGMRAIPEPATLVLVLASALGFAVSHRRRLG